MCLNAKQKVESWKHYTAALIKVQREHVHHLRSPRTLHSMAAHFGDLTLLVESRLTSLAMETDL